MSGTAWEVGQTVIVRTDYGRTDTLDRIKRVLKQYVELENDHRRFNLDGNERGGIGWNRASIHPASPEQVEIVKRNSRALELRAAMRAQAWNAVPLDKLERIYVILVEERAT